MTEAEKLSDVVRSSLAEALRVAQATISAVSKDARNEFSGYDYASAESIITEARRALIASGLTVYRKEWCVESAQPWPLVVATFVVTNGTESFTATCPFPVVDGRGKPPDKAVATALTSCLAYWLRDLLLIPRCDEEMDRRNDADCAPAAVPPSDSPASGPVDRMPPRTLAELGGLLLDMAGGDLAKARALCRDLLGVESLRGYKGYLPDALEKVWEAYKDGVGANADSAPAAGSNP